MVSTSSPASSSRFDAFRATQKGAAAVGAAFLLVGVLGFVPGVTTNYDGMEFAGHTSDAKLLGLFQVSVLHNLIHVLFGLAGLVSAKAHRTAQVFLVGGGLTYLAIWLYGVAVDQESAANFVPLNDADDWLHLALGLGMVALGLVLPRAQLRR